MSLLKGQDELDLTDGGIVRPLIYLSMPIVITNLMQTAYNLADTFWLGQYSTTALAAISFGFPMVFLLISFGLGISVAGSVLVAQHTGAGETRQAEYAASQTVTFAIIGSVLLGAVGYPFIRPFITFLGAEPAVIPGATAYLQVITLGMPFMFGFFMFISLMRGAGDTVTPMYVMFGTVVLNIVLDPFLINGWYGFPELGVQGAAIATVISRGLAMVIGIAIMLWGARGIQIRLSMMKPDMGYLKRILNIGIPASIEGTGRALSINALMLVVGMFSTPVVAAFGIGTRVFSVIFLPAIAVSQGVETMTGQNIGAGKPDRAEVANYVAAKGLFAVLAVVGVLIFVFPSPIVNVFTEDPDVLGIGTDFLRWVALSFGFIGIMRAFTGGFRGAGETMIAAVITVATLGAVRLPVAYLASQFFLGVHGIWLAFFASNVAGGIMAWLWFRRGTWRTGDVRGRGSGPPGRKEVETTPAND